MKTLYIHLFPWIHFYVIKKRHWDTYIFGSYYTYIPHCNTHCKTHCKTNCNTHSNTHCNTHWNTHCNNHCDKHFNTHCNTHCNTPCHACICTHKTDSTQINLNKKSLVNPRSTSSQSSQPCTVLQYPSRKECACEKRIGIRRIPKKKKKEHTCDQHPTL